MAGKLRIPDLITPRAKIADLFDAPQEVGVAQSPTVEQHCLIHNVHPDPHRLQSLLSAPVEALATGQIKVGVQLHCPEPL